MDKPKPRSSPHDVASKDSRTRKSTEAQPIATDDVVLETYEQSPDRPNEDEQDESGASTEVTATDDERAKPD